MKTSKSKAGPAILQGPETFVDHKFLHRVFEEGMTEHASYEKPALIYEDEGVSRRVTKYAEMNRNANQLANKMLDLIKESAIKVNPDGDWIIAICMRPSDSLVTTLLGTWKAGAAYLPINVGSPQNRIEHILNEAKPALVIYDRTYKNPKFFSNTKSITFDDLKRESREMSVENIPNHQMLSKGDESSKAMIIYTSGSTGMPKGVRLAHHTFIHRIQWQMETYPYADSETHCIAKTTLSFIDHVAEMWCPLFAGKTLVVVPNSVVMNPERFVPLLDEFRIQRLLGVPTLLRSVLMFLNIHEANKTKFMLSKLRVWISSGETLPLQLVNEFFEYFDHGKQILLNLYGCTEVTCDVSCYEIKSKQQMTTFDKVPLGSPLPSTIIYILDQNKKVAAEGDVGEIYCAGVMVTDGYIARRDPEAFCENHLESNPPYHRMYKTGDFGMVKDNLLFFEGRRDAQIKIRGHRIDISEVEKNVNELSYVGKSAVLVYHAMQTDQALVAFVEKKKNFDITEKTSIDVEKDLKSRLADYMIPQVEIVEEFPFLPNGKVDRQELLKMYEDVTSSNTVVVQVEVDLKHVPKEKLKTARQVFEIIGQSLGKELRKKVSMKSNFFELGGNSMNSIFTVTELRKKGFYIGITDFLTADNLGVVLKKITLRKVKSNDLKIATDMGLVKEPLDELEKQASMFLLAKSFFTKSEIDQFLPELKIEHYIEVLDEMWDKATNNGFSFMVKNDNSDLVGVSLNFDAKDEPAVNAENPLKTIFDFLSFIETPVLNSKVADPSVGKTFHCLMMGTAEGLKAKDNIAIMAFMESEIIKIAKEKGFEGILTTNTNPLTVQFGETVFEYETAADIHVNQYVDASGKRPFGKAPDSTKAVVMFKELK